MGNMKRNVVFEKNRRLMEQADALIRMVRKQDYYQMAQLQKEVIGGLQDMIKDKTLYKAYFQDEFLESTFMSIMKGLLEAQEQEDHIMYADLVQLELVPFVQAIQASIYEKDGMILEEDKIEKTRAYLKQYSFYPALEKIPVPSPEEYHVVPSTTGALTVQIRSPERQFYLHSNVDPQEEADLLVEEYFDSCYRHYIVLGLGLGYHIAALNRRCFQAAEIDVYESDLNLIKLAAVYGLPEDMLTENVHIHHDLSCKEMARTLRQNHISFAVEDREEQAPGTDAVQFILHYPSIRNLRSPELEETFDKFRAKESSMRNNKDRMAINFRENIQHYDHYADELKEDFRGKDVYLIAAGPSLDQTIGRMKQIERSKSVILAVGTVFRKLLTQDIIPDYVIFLDPGERTYGHIRGLESQQIPILIASTAYRKIAENYEGPVYLICQEGYQKAEQYARRHDYGLYSTGGSVSTIALDVAIRLGAARIICTGLDLAYPNHVSHAEGTMDRQQCDMSNGYRVKSFDGGTVETSNLFLIYREWIEKRIRAESQCRFFNTSVGGAYIEGMQHCLLEDVPGVF